MRKILIFALSLALASCGSGSSPTFEGVWDATFQSLDDNCPFALNPNVNELFPMTVTVTPGVPADTSFTFTGANGEIAVGGQGDGEEISASANADAFGNYGSILPYVCTPSSRVTMLSVGNNRADISLVYIFDNCTTPTNPSQVINCFATYYYKGNRV